MNDHGAMTVRIDETNETRQVVDFETASIRSTLERLPVGTTLPMEMESVGSRGNAWLVNDLVDSGVPTADASAGSRYGTTHHRGPENENGKNSERAEI
jgi:hypothetical protein